jgi:hypothetical protein
VKIARILGTVAVATVAAAGAAAPAFASTSEVPQNVAAVQTRVGVKAQHITAKMQALQSRLTTKPHLNAVRNTLQTDINKVVTDTNAWRQQIAAATTMAGVRAADPAHQAVIADLVKLRTDLAAAKGTKTTTANTTANQPANPANQQANPANQQANPANQQANPGADTGN